MTSTLVIVCPKCGRLLLAKKDQKTRTCPYCGATVDTQKARKLASAPDAYKASEIMRQLKTERNT